MSNLSEIKKAVSNLTDTHFAKLRKWFWEYDNQRWDKEINKRSSKLDDIAAKAADDFKRGNFKNI